jgi:hypothetical protein
LRVADDELIAFPDRNLSQYAIRFFRYGNPADHDVVSFFEKVGAHPLFLEARNRPIRENDAIGIAFGPLKNEANVPFDLRLPHGRGFGVAGE